MLQLSENKCCTLTIPFIRMHRLIQQNFLYRKSLATGDIIYKYCYASLCMTHYPHHVNKRGLVVIHNDCFSQRTHFIATFFPFDIL